MKNVLLERLTWVEVKEALRTADIVIVPIGSLEQHGPHLTLRTDTMVVKYVAENAALRVEGVLVAPAIPYGFSLNHIDFPGTASISPDTLKALIEDVSKTLAHHGFKIIVLLNGHGGNNATVSVAAEELREEIGALVANIYWPDLVRESYKLMESKVIWHSDENETSTVMAISPKDVRTDKITKEIPENIPLFVFDERALSGGRVDLGLPRTKMITSSGIVGDPTLARPEKGTAVLTEAVNALCAILEDLRKVLASGKFRRERFDTSA